MNQDFHPFPPSISEQKNIPGSWRQTCSAQMSSKSLVHPWLCRLGKLWGLEWSWQRFTKGHVKICRNVFVTKNLKLEIFGETIAREYCLFKCNKYRDIVEELYAVTLLYVLSFLIRYGAFHGCFSVGAGHQRVDCLMTCGVPHPYSESVFF